LLIVLIHFSTYVYRHGEKVITNNRSVACE